MRERTGFPRQFVCYHRPAWGPGVKGDATDIRIQMEEIVKTKEPDLTAADMDAAVRTIAGTARSIGLNTEGVE